MKKRQHGKKSTKMTLCPNQGSTFHIKYSYLKAETAVKVKKLVH